MKALFIIWLILMAILICVRMQVHVQWPAIRADAQAPTATPTPVGPNYCTVTGLVVNADGTPLVNGTISFNSTRIQVVGGVVINPTYVSTNTDAQGNIRAITLPMGLVVQVTICPPSQGQGQSATCSAPYQVIVPFAPTGDFGEMSQGTALVTTSTLSLTTLQVTGTLTFPDGMVWSGSGLNNVNVTGNYLLNGYNLFQGASTGSTVNGAWNPVLQFGGGSNGQAPFVVNGQWATSGKIATWEFIIALNNKGTSTGVATVGGLPAAMWATSATNAYGTCANLGGVSVGPAGYPYRFYPGMGPGQPGTILLYADTSENVAVQLNDTNFTTTPNFQCTMTYIIQ